MYRYALSCRRVDAADEMGVEWLGQGGTGPRHVPMCLTGGGSGSISCVMRGKEGAKQIQVSKRARSCAFKRAAMPQHVHRERPAREEALGTGAISSALTRTIAPIFTICTRPGLAFWALPLASPSPPRQIPRGRRKHIVVYTHQMVAHGGLAQVQAPPSSTATRGPRRLVCLGWPGGQAFLLPRGILWLALSTERRRRTEKHERHFCRCAFLLPGRPPHTHHRTHPFIAPIYASLGLLCVRPSPRFSLSGHGIAKAVARPTSVISAQKKGESRVLCRHAQAPTRTSTTRTLTHTPQHPLIPSCAPWNDPPIPSFPSSTHPRTSERHAAE